MSAYMSRIEGGDGNGNSDAASTVVFEGVPGFEIVSGACADSRGENTAEGETSTVSVHCSSLGQDGEMLINTIEVSTEELMSMEQMNSEEVEFIYSPNIQFQVESINEGENNSQVGVSLQQTEANNSITVNSGENCRDSGNVTTFRFLNHGPHLVVQRPETSQHTVLETTSAVLCDSQSRNLRQTAPTLQDINLTTIDGKQVSFHPASESTKVTATFLQTSSKTEPINAASNSVIFASEIQGFEQQIPTIIETATLAQQTVNAALTTYQPLIATSSNMDTQTSALNKISSDSTLSGASHPQTVNIEVSEGTTVQLQKYYCQERLCRVCLLSKDNLTSIFEDVTIDSKGLIENTRGPNASNKFQLLAALKMLLDIEVEHDDGLPHVICMECHDLITNFSVYRKRIAIGQAKLQQILEKVKYTNTPTFIPALGEIDSQKTGVYKFSSSIERAKELLNKSQYSHFVHRNLSDRLWDKIFSSFSSIVGYKSNKLKNLEHFTREVPYVTGFFCYTCNSTIHGTKDDFSQHHYDFHGIVSSEDVLFPCDICGNSYPLKDCTGESKNYSEHWLQHFFIHECSLCNKRFPSSKGLWIHKKSVHSHKERAFVCNEENCEKSFYKKSQLETHKRSHNAEFASGIQKQYVCDRCCKCFNTSANLNVHLSTVHDTERRWKCDFSECQKRFKRKENLISHKATVHMNIRKHACEICKQTFKSLSSKSVHMLKHKGEKLHTCEICSQQFYTSNGLKSHKLKHQDTGTFPCNECSKVFKRAAYLEEHRRTHTGEKPFMCPVCNRAIRMKSNYFKHLRIHKRKNEVQ